MPNVPVIQTSFLSTLTTTVTLSWSPVDSAEATLLTPEVPRPKLVRYVIKVAVEGNRPVIHIPEGPKRRATNFDRMTEIIILNT